MFRLEIERIELVIKDHEGRDVVRQYRYAYSSKAKSAEEVSDGVGFDGKDRDIAIAGNARQLDEWTRMVAGLNAA